MRPPDPRSLLFFAVSAGLSALVGPVPALAALVLSLLLSFSCKIPLRRYGLLATSFLPVTLFLPLAPSLLTVPLIKAVGFSVAVLTVVAATRWDRLLAAVQAIGVPRTVLAFLLVLFSHVEGVLAEAHDSREALVLRGGFSRGIRSLPASTRWLLVRLLRRSLDRADRTAEALTLRGFEGRLPALESWRPGLADLLPVGAGIACLLLTALPGSEWIP